MPADRLLELAVLADALINRRLVYRFGVAGLDVRDPEAQEAPPDVGKAVEKAHSMRSVVWWQA